MRDLADVIALGWSCKIVVLCHEAVKFHVTHARRGICVAI